jgi:hypothetical protein
VDHHVPVAGFLEKTERLVPIIISSGGMEAIDYRFPAMSTVAIGMNGIEGIIRLWNLVLLFNVY